RARDLLPERRADRARREVGAVHAEPVVERALHLVDPVGLELARRDLEDVLAEIRVVDALDLRVAVAERAERVAHLLHARRPLHGRGDSRARLEVDAEL